MDNIFEVVTDDSTAQYNTLFDAYKSVDNISTIQPIKEYVTDNLANTTTSKMFAKEFAMQVNNLANILMQKEDADISEWYAIYNSNDERLLEPMYVKNNENYITQVNHILKTLGYTAYIRKSADYVKDNIKHYFNDNTSAFLEVVNTLIEHQLYTTYEWQKGKIDNTKVNAKYDSAYSDEDSYNWLKDGIIYSATQIKVLTDFMSDIDNIITILYENSSEVCNYGIPAKLIMILR